MSVVTEAAVCPWKARALLDHSCRPDSQYGSKPRNASTPLQDMDHLLHPCKTAEVRRAKLPPQWDCVSHREASRCSTVLLMESYL